MNVRLLVVFQAAMLVAAGAAHADSKADLDALQGSWTCTAVNFDSKDQPEAAGQITLTVTGDAYKIDEKGRGTTESGKLKVDGDKKTLDFLIEKSEAKDDGKTQLAVYKLEGDAFSYNAAEPGGTERPKAVGAAEKQMFVTFKKGAAAAASPAASPSPAASAAPSPAPSAK